MERARSRQRPLRADRPRGLVLLLTLASIAAAIAAAALMARTIADSGENVLSGFDYFVTRDVARVLRVLDGDASLLGYLQQTTVLGTHPIAFPFMLRMAVVWLADWSMAGELWLVFALSCAEVLLVWDAVSRRVGTLIRWVSLPLLAAIEFSATQVNHFTWGAAGLYFQTMQLGVAMAVWGLVRWPEHRRGVVLAAVGGIIATFSFGVGAVVWPLLLVGAWLAGVRGRWRLGGLAGAALVSGGLLATVLDQSRNPVPGHVRRVPPADVIIDGIGMPMSSTLGSVTSTVPGVVGAVLLATALVVLALLVRSGLPGRRITVPFVYIGLGMATIVAVASMRSDLSKWYSSLFEPVWIGIVATLVLFADAVRRSERGSVAGVAAAAWCIAAAVCIAVLVVTSRGRVEDKSVYAYARSPFVASCLRAHETRLSSPFDACARYFYGTYIARAADASALVGQPRGLDARGLSVFGSERELTLQGDFTSPLVDWTTRAGAAAPRWLDGDDEVMSSDARRRDLELQPSTRLTWRVRIPEGSTRMTLRAPIVSGRDGVEVSVLDADGEVLLDGEQLTSDRSSVPIDVRRAGDVTVVLAVADDARGAVRLESPVVRQSVGDGARAGDASPVVAAPPIAKRDIDLPAVTDADAWNERRPNRDLLGRWRFPQARELVRPLGSRHVLRTPIDACIADVSALELRHDTAGPGWYGVQVLLDTDLPGLHETSIVVPVRAGEDASIVTLRELGIPDSSQLRGIMLQPVQWTGNRRVSRRSRVDVTGVRIVRRPPTEACQ